MKRAVVVALGGLLLFGSIAAAFAVACSSRDERVTVDRSRERIDEARAKARAAAAMGLEAQTPEIQARYYEGRRRGTERALKTQRLVLRELQQQREKAQGDDATELGRRIATLKQQIRRMEDRLAEAQHASTTATASP